MVQNATAMNNAWVELGLAVEGIGNKIGNDWSGTVTNVLKASSRWIEGNQPLAASLTEIGALTAAIKPAQWMLRFLGLGAAAGALGTAATLSTPLMLSGDTPTDPLLNQPATSPGFFGQGGTLKRWFRHPFGGSSAKKNPADPNQLRSYFKSQGWSDPQIAGILGNYQGESGMDAANVGDQGASAGLGMWRGQRRGAFRLMFGHDVSEGTPLEQAKFTQWELTHTEKDAGDHLRATTSAREAGAVFSREYERPKDVGMNAALRGQYAVTWQQKFDAEPAVGTPGRNVAARTNGAADQTQYPKPGDHVPGTIGQTYGNAPPDGTPGQNSCYGSSVTLEKLSGRTLSSTLAISGGIAGEIDQSDQLGQGDFRWIENRP
jgi:hypothetical protein